MSDNFFKHEFFLFLKVSSLTSSPDSSPSPMTSIGMVNGSGPSNMMSDPKTWGASSTSPNSPASKNYVYDSSASGGQSGNNNNNNNNNNNPSGLSNPSASGSESGQVCSQISLAALTSRLEDKTRHLLMHPQGQLVNVLDTHGSSGPNSGNHSLSSITTSGAKMPPLIRDLLTAIDDKEWQHSLFNLLQNQTYNQCEVDLFELLCKVLDQNLFAQVDWARNSIFFKDLKV